MSLKTFVIGLTLSLMSPIFSLKASITAKDTVYSMLSCLRCVPNFSDTEVTVSFENKENIEDPNLKVGPESSYFYLYPQYQQQATAQTALYKLRAMSDAGMIKWDTDDGSIDPATVFPDKFMNFEFKSSQSGALSEGLPVMVASLMAATGAKLKNDKTIFFGEVGLSGMYIFKDFIRKLRAVIDSYEVIVVPEMARAWITNNFTDEQKAKIVYINHITDLDQKDLFDKEIFDPANITKRIQVAEGVGVHPVGDGGLVKVEFMLLDKKKYNDDEKDVIIGSRENTVNVANEVRNCLLEYYPEVCAALQLDKKIMVFRLHGISGGDSWGALAVLLVRAYHEKKNLRSIPITGKAFRTVNQIQANQTMRVAEVRLKSEAIAAAYKDVKANPSSVDPKLVLPRSNIREIINDVEGIGFNDEFINCRNVKDIARKRIDELFDKLICNDPDEADEKARNGILINRMQTVDTPGVLLPKVVTKNIALQFCYCVYLVTVFPIASLLQLIFSAIGWIDSKSCNFLKNVKPWNIDVILMSFCFKILISPTYLIDFIAGLITQISNIVVLSFLFVTNFVISVLGLIFGILGFKFNFIWIEPSNYPEKVRRNIFSQTSKLRCMYYMYVEMYKYQIA